MSSKFSKIFVIFCSRWPSTPLPSLTWNALPYRPFTSRMINFSPLVTTNSHSWRPLTKELKTTWKIIASHEGSKKWIVTIATVSKHENLYIKTFQSIYGMVFIWINLCVILFLWIKENRYRHFNLFYCCKIFRMDRSFFPVIHYSDFLRLEWFLKQIS